MIDVKIIHCSTDDVVGDFFTKPLQIKKSENSVNWLWILERSKSIFFNKQWRFNVYEALPHFTIFTMSDYEKYIFPSWVDHMSVLSGEKLSHVCVGLWFYRTTMKCVLIGTRVILKYNWWWDYVTISHNL